MDWKNIERCAQSRADAKTFNWDEESNPLGDLETREMARFMGYRDALVKAISESLRLK